MEIFLPIRECNGQLTSMNKTQLVVLLVSVFLAVAIVGILHGRKQHAHFITVQTRQIGVDLVEATNSAKLVRVGSGLQAELMELLAFPTDVAVVRLGDAPSPIGNRTACSQLILTNSRLKRLGIRLRQDSDPESFHVLGYWNIRE